MWCYTCEPKSENTVLADFDIFPEPSNSSTWQDAQKYVVSKAGAAAPLFHPEIVPGTLFSLFCLHFSKMVICRLIGI